MVCLGKSICFHTSFVTLLNLPQIYFGFSVLTEIPCRASTWLLINIPLAMANIIAAFYMSSALTKSSSLEEFPTPKSRLSLFFKNTWFAAYNVVLLGSVIFTVVGYYWVENGTARVGEKCSEKTYGMMESAVDMNFVFYIVSLISFCLAMCCVCCSPSNREEQLPLISPPPPVTEEEGKGKEVPEPVVEEVSTIKAVEDTVEQPKEASGATVETPLETGSVAAYGATTTAAVVTAAAETTTTEKDSKVLEETAGTEEPVTEVAATEADEKAAIAPKNNFVGSFLKVRDFFDGLKPTPKINYHK